MTVYKDRTSSLAAKSTIKKTLDLPFMDMAYVKGGSFSMAYVKGGSFSMGSNEGRDDEKPVREVQVDDFLIGTYEVTVGQFRKFIEETNYRTDADKEGWSWVWNAKRLVNKNGVNWGHDVYGNLRRSSEDNHPVIHVSWNDAQELINWLNSKYGMNFRLPTEAEWEYAARGGQKSQGYTYAGSNTLGSVGWYNENSGEKTHPVGQKQPNELGIYDMSGNVWEWCQDWYDENYYSASVRNNPTGPSSGQDRVLRGGSWEDRASVIRFAKPLMVSPGSRYSLIGFRVARDL